MPRKPTAKKNPSFRTALSFFAVTIFSLGLVFSLGIVIWQNPHRGDTLIQVARLFTSWPVVVAALGLTAGIAFQSEIKSLLNGIASFTLHFPGGRVDAKREQPDTTSESTDKNKKPVITLTEAQRQETLQIINEIEAVVTGMDTEHKKLITNAENQLKAKERQLLHWRFEFLSVFFVRDTKRALHLIANALPNLNRSHYDEACKLYIPNSQQRQVILNVLTYHEIVAEVDGRLTVTALGKQFIDYENAKVITT